MALFEEKRKYVDRLTGADRILAKGYALIHQRTVQKEQNGQSFVIVTLLAFYDKEETNQGEEREFANAAYKREIGFAVPADKTGVADLYPQVEWELIRQALERDKADTKAIEAARAYFLD